MAVLLAIPLLGVLLILQSAIVSQVVLLRGTADIILLAVIAWALQKRVKTAWHWAVVGGVMVSFVSALPYGTSLIGYLIATALALIMRRRIWQIPLMSMLVTTFAATLFMHALVILTLRISGTQVPLLLSLNQVTLPSILLNLLLAIPMYALIGDMANWIYPEPIER